MRKEDAMSSEDYRSCSSEEGDACEGSNEESQRVRGLACLRCNDSFITIQ